MNRINLIGRTTKAPERRSTTTGKHVALFTLAVNRRYDRDKADFIGCVAWGKLADLVMEYVGKGQLIAIVGELHIDSYQTSDGTTKRRRLPMRLRVMCWTALKCCPMMRICHFRR